MARFVILDQSLTGVGGYHFEHAVRLLRAADQLGFEPVLVTRAEFMQLDLLPPHWITLPRFADATYDCPDDYPIDLEGNPLPVPGLATPRPARRIPLVKTLRTAAALWRTHTRRSRIERFADACEQVDEELVLRGADRVLLPTVSLFDLLGLARFFQTARRLPTVTFHVLFHRGFLTGRGGEYDRQREVERRVYCQLDYVLQNMPRGQLRFYGTTERVADQFNRLDLAHFDVQPFPVEPSVFQNKRRGLAGQPLRLICTGFLQRKKGEAIAADLVRSLWPGELRPGHLQLVMQTNRRLAPRMLPSDRRPAMRIKSDLPGRSEGPIVWLKHPLERDTYIRLIRDTDIGVFLHDDLAYYARCSGALVEMLAGGMPVLVPAGSWLSDQISDAIYEHLDTLGQSTPVVAELDHRHLIWRTSESDSMSAEDRQCVEFGDPSRSAQCQVAIPDQATALLVAFRWDYAAWPGSYVRLAARTDGADPRATPTCERVAVLTPRHDGRSVSALVPLSPGSRAIHLSLSNAFDRSVLTVQGLSCRFLAQSPLYPNGYPSGQVGLIYEHVGHIPDLVRELREHYAHYLDSAHRFANQWCRRHDAERIVRRIVDSDEPAVRAVA